MAVSRNMTSNQHDSNRDNDDEATNRRLPLTAAAAALAGSSIMPGKAGARVIRSNRDGDLDLGGGGMN